MFLITILKGNQMQQPVMFLNLYFNAVSLVELHKYLMKVKLEILLNDHVFILNAL